MSSLLMLIHLCILLGFVFPRNYKRFLKILFIQVRPLLYCCPIYYLSPSRYYLNLYNILTFKTVSKSFLSFYSSVNYTFVCLQLFLLLTVLTHSFPKKSIFNILISMSLLYCSFWW